MCSSESLESGEGDRDPVLWPLIPHAHIPLPALCLFPLKEHFVLPSSCIPSLPDESSDLLRISIDHDEIWKKYIVGSFIPPQYLPFILICGRGVTFSSSGNFPCSKYSREMSVLPLKYVSLSLRNII